MKELLNNISNSNLVTITILMCVVALFLAIAIAIEIYKNAKKTETRVLKVNTDSSNINIKEVDGIKYVDEDAELEKTKARIELAELKERLRKEEIEKNKLLDMNLALANKKEEVIKSENIDINKEKEEVVKIISSKEQIIIEDKPVIVENETTINNIEKTTQEEKVVENNTLIEEKNFVQEYKPVEENIEILSHESEDEDSAIISFEELKTSVNTSLLEDGTINYEDEKTAVISIRELERLYEESLSINTEPTEVKKEVELMEFDLNKKDLSSTIASFNSTPFISPIHGLSQTENDIILTSTANLERLNKEIKKTNEFLQALKVLKKNLE